jgi:hypothetical protein
MERIELSAETLDGAADSVTLHPTRPLFYIDLGNMPKTNVDQLTVGYKGRIIEDEAIITCPYIPTFEVVNTSVDVPARKLKWTVELEMLSFEEHLDPLWETDPEMMEAFEAQTRHMALSIEDKEFALEMFVAGWDAQEKRMEAKSTEIHVPHDKSWYYTNANNVTVSNNFIINKK